MLLEFKAYIQPKGLYIYFIVDENLGNYENVKTLFYGNIREISTEILTQNLDELKIDKVIKIRKNKKQKI